MVKKLIQQNIKKQAYSKKTIVQTSLFQSNVIIGNQRQRKPTSKIQESLGPNSEFIKRLNKTNKIEKVDDKKLNTSSIQKVNEIQQEINIQKDLFDQIDKNMQIVAVYLKSIDQIQKKILDNVGQQILKTDVQQNEIDNQSKNYLVKLTNFKTKNKSLSEKYQKKPNNINKIPLQVKQKKEQLKQTKVNSSDKVDVKSIQKVQVKTTKKVEFKPEIKLSKRLALQSKKIKKN